MVTQRNLAIRPVEERQIGKPAQPAPVKLWRICSISGTADRALRDLGAGSRHEHLDPRSAPAEYSRIGKIVSSMRPPRLLERSSFCPDAPGPPISTGDGGTASDTSMARLVVSDQAAARKLADTPWCQPARLPAVGLSHCRPTALAKACSAVSPSNWRGSMGP